MIKKILTIAVLGVVLVSCNGKKEANKENNTANKENSVSEKGGDSKLPAAISDSMGVYKIKFRLEKGKTYPFVSNQKDVMSMKDPSGQAIEESQEVTDKYSFLINDFSNGVYDITVKLDDKVNKIKTGGKDYLIDIKSAEPKEDMLKAMWNVNKALVGNTLNVKMKETGEIVSVSGFETIYRNVEKRVQELTKDAKKTVAFIQGFKQGFGEKSFKAQLEKNLNVLPKKGVKLGEKWTETENLSPDGKLKHTTSYTLTKVDRAEAQITIEGGIPKTSKSQKEANFTQSLTIDGTQKGAVVLDATSGWIKNSKQEVKTTQTQTITDGKRTQSQTQTSTSVLSIN